MREKYNQYFNSEKKNQVKPYTIKYEIHDFSHLQTPVLQASLDSGVE